MFYVQQIESPVRSYGGYCVQPKSGDCNPMRNRATWSHALIFKKADKNCLADYMQFYLDKDDVIHHKCSGKVVCPYGKGNKLEFLSQKYSTLYFLTLFLTPFFNRSSFFHGRIYENRKIAYFQKIACILVNMMPMVLFTLKRAKD